MSFLLLARLAGMLSSSSIAGFFFYRLLPMAPPATRSYIHISLPEPPIPQARPFSRYAVNEAAK